MRSWPQVFVSTQELSFLPSYWQTSCLQSHIEPPKSYFNTCKEQGPPLDFLQSLAAFSPQAQQTRSPCNRDIKELAHTANCNLRACWLQDHLPHLSFLSCSWPAWVFLMFFLCNFVLIHHSYMSEVEKVDFVYVHSAILFRGPCLFPDFLALVLTVPCVLSHGIYGSQSTTAFFALMRADLGPYSIAHVMPTPGEYVPRIPLHPSRLGQNPLLPLPSCSI